MSKNIFSYEKNCVHCRHDHNTQNRPWCDLSQTEITLFKLAHEFAPRHSGTSAYRNSYVKGFMDGVKKTLESIEEQFNKGEENA
jgi:hypothetical protein